VSALKVVDFPTFGSPTSPMPSPMIFLKCYSIIIAILAKYWWRGG